MEMEPTYDPCAVEARWLGRREPGSVLPAGGDRSAPGPEARRIAADMLDRWSRMGGGDPDGTPDITPFGERNGSERNGGVDAFRLSVALRNPGGRRPGRFLNKLWHVSRWSLQRIESNGTLDPDPEGEPAVEDRWITGVLDRTVRRITEAFTAGDLAAASREADEFVRTALSATWVPLAKERDDPAVVATLTRVLGRLLVLLHPIVPVVSEEIRNHLSRVLGEPPARLDDGPWPEPEGNGAVGNLDPALVLTWQELAGRVVAQDPAVELARLRSRFDALADRIRAVDRNLSNRDFVTRAPPEVVARRRTTQLGSGSKAS